MVSHLTSAQMMGVKQKKKTHHEAEVDQILIILRGCSSTESSTFVAGILEGIIIQSALFTLYSLQI